MKTTLERGMLAAALLATAPLAAQQPAAAPAGAQGAACDIDETKPREMGLAGFALARAGQAAKPEDKAKHLREVVKNVAESGDRTQNPTGRAFYLGQAIIYYLSEVNPAEQVKRGDLGFGTDKERVVDALALADSLFTAVEERHPGCVARTQEWRAQKPWFTMVQATFRHLGAGNQDSAQALARRSLVINRRSAYAPYALAAIASQRQQRDTALRYYADAIRLAKGDTTMQEIHSRSLLDAGRLEGEAAELASGAARQEAARRAVGHLTEFLAVAGTTPEASGARSMLADMLLSAGDTAKVVSVYEGLFSAPEKYGDYEFTQAGVTMTRLNKLPEAQKYFEEAVKLNPWQRDALNNLAATYQSQNAFTKMIPVIDRLVKVDPSNPDNWLWYAYAYQGLARSEKAPAKKRQYTDSLVKYNKLSEDMPVKVQFTGFFRGEADTKLVGTIENRTAAPKSYTLKVEFIDKAGNVVQTGTANVGPVAAKKSAEFTVTAPKAEGIAAFRYAPVG